MAYTPTTLAKTNLKTYPMKFLKTSFLIVVNLFVLNVYAQDTIIKTDQTEISAKVNEITDTAIKYKFWDRQNGPTYNIGKSEIFMIIYQDGTKEYYSSEKTNNITIKSPKNNEPKSKPISVNGNKPTIDKNLLNTTTKNKTTISNENTTTSIDKNLLEKSQSRNSASNKTTSSHEKEEEEEDNFVYREAAKFNYGFGYDLGAANSAITIGLYAPYAFTKERRGSLELEVGGTGIFTSGSTFGSDVSTSIYALSLTLGYGYYILDDLHAYAGLGYYYGFGGTRIDGERVGDANINGIYYATGVNYWLTSGFGFNVRYDAIMGPSVGITFKNF